MASKNSKKRGGPKLQVKIDASDVRNAVRDLIKRAEIRTHELKSWPENFAATLAGIKPYETRQNDRGFNVAERIRLREWIPSGFGDGFGLYTGRELQLVIVRVSASDRGLREGYVTLTVAHEAPAT